MGSDRKFAAQTGKKIPMIKKNYTALPKLLAQCLKIEMAPANLFCCTNVGLLGWSSRDLANQQVWVLWHWEWDDTKDYPLCVFMKQSGIIPNIARTSVSS